MPLLLGEVPVTALGLKRPRAHLQPQGCLLTRRHCPPPRFFSGKSKPTHLILKYFRMYLHKGDVGQRREDWGPSSLPVSEVGGADGLQPPPRRSP